MFANDIVFSGYTVDSISCCIDLHCCKLLRKGLDVLPPSSDVWHLYELDLPPLLSKETWDRPKRGSKWRVLFLKLLPWICKVVLPFIEALDYSILQFTEVYSDKFVKTCRPILDPIASIFHRLLCGRSERSDARGQTVDTSPLPGSDSIEANRRRLAFVALSSVLVVHNFFLLVTFCSYAILRSKQHYFYCPAFSQTSISVACFYRIWIHVVILCSTSWVVPDAPYLQLLSPWARVESQFVPVTFMFDCFLSLFYYCSSL